MFGVGLGGFVMILDGMCWEYGCLVWYKTLF